MPTTPAGCENHDDGTKSGIDKVIASSIDAVFCCCNHSFIDGELLNLVRYPTCTKIFKIPGWYVRFGTGLVKLYCTAGRSTVVENGRGERERARQGARPRACVRVVNIRSFIGPWPSLSVGFANRACKNSCPDVKRVDQQSESELNGAGSTYFLLVADR